MFVNVSRFAIALLCLAGISNSLAIAEEPAKLAAALITGDGPDWKSLTLDDFENVNGKEDTWSMKEGVIHCTGNPVSVTRTKNKVTNFELVTEWRHLKPAGNSGIFVWTTPESIEKLGRKSGLPQGIEVQVLDTGYAAQYEKSTGKKGDWFTSHGDVFPVGVKMTPFPPTSPNGQRSFPKKSLVKDSPEWNHYYVRAINGEVRLWVNGEEISGGTNIEPRTGYLCLESEGSPVEFQNMKLRELP